MGSWVVQQDDIFSKYLILQERPLVSRFGLGIARSHPSRDCSTLQHYALVVIDTTSGKEYLTLITHIRQQAPETKIVVATASPSWPFAREVFRAGAIDYLSKAMSPRELLVILASILAPPTKTPSPSLLRTRGTSMRTPTILFAENDVPFLDARKDFLLQEGYHSILKFFQVDITGIVRMTSCARYCKEGVGSRRPHWRWILCFFELPKANTSCKAFVKRLS